MGGSIFLDIGYINQVPVAKNVTTGYYYFNIKVDKITYKKELNTISNDNNATSKHFSIINVIGSPILKNINDDKLYC